MSIKGHFYDVVIIGSNLSGFILGAILVKYGLNVALVRLQQDEFCIKKDGFEFYLTDDFLKGFGPDEIFTKIFHSLGLSLGERKKFKLADYIFQTIWPDERIEIPTIRYQKDQREQIIDYALFFNVIGQLFPKEILAIKEFYEEIGILDDFVRGVLSEALVPPVAFTERLRLDRVLKHCNSYFNIKKDYGDITLSNILDSYNLSQSFKDFIFSQIISASYTSPKDISAYAGAYIIGSLLKGIYKISGMESKEIIKIMESRISSLTGYVTKPSKIENINLEKMIEIKLEENKDLKVGGVNNPLCSKYLVCNTYFPSFYKFIPPKFFRSRFFDRFFSIKPTYFKFTIQLGVDSNVIPVGMYDKVIIFPKEIDSKFGEGIIFLSVNPVVEDFKPNENKSIITSSAIIPLENDTPSLELMKNYANIIYRSLKELIPFLDNYIISNPISEILNYYANNIAEKHLYYKPSMVDRLGISLFPNKTAYSNIFFTGRAVLPGLGIEGEALSAWNTAKLILSSMGIKM